MNSSKRIIYGFGAIGALIALGGCAASSTSKPSVPRFAEQMSETWAGVPDTSREWGIVLVVPPGPYTKGSFALQSHAGEHISKWNPSIRWTSVDSSHPQIAALRGWDLDSLAIQLQSDPGVWIMPPRIDGIDLAVREAKLNENTRQTLHRIAASMNLGYLLAIRPGGVSNAKDSLPGFQDASWFGIFDLQTASLLYSVDIASQATRSETTSAEESWAQQVWSEFVGKMQVLPSRRKQADVAEPH